MGSKDALALALFTLQMLPQLVKLTQEAVSLINQSVKVIKTAQAEDRDPTPAEWDALLATIQELRDQRDAELE